MRLWLGELVYGSVGGKLLDCDRGISVRFIYDMGEKVPGFLSDRLYRDWIYAFYSEYLTPREFT